MTTAMHSLALPLDATNLNPGAGHILGHVADDWAAAEVWLKSVQENSRNGGTQTDATYRFHLAKLRWYCENVLRITPSRWSTQDVSHFRTFLQDLPADAICKAGAKRGENGWTPFKKQPSASSQADILRFVHALFNGWHKAGYIMISPMALTGARTVRKVDAERAVPLDLYSLVLEVMADEPKATYTDRQYYARDRFIFEALRGLGLRASELVGANMGAFRQVTAPKSGTRYWTFYVTAETGKGGKERIIPVTRAVWDAYNDYRGAFNLSRDNGAADKGLSLILSPRTKDVLIGKREIKRTADRRFFKSWGEVNTRQGLYRIVKARLARAADTLVTMGRPDDAALLNAASPHWLRHTFGKSSLLSGHDMRVVAGAMGHADLSTTMIYTQQQALDLIDSWERATPGAVARDDTILAEITGATPANAL